jgi:hypothetical protein
MTNPMKSDTQAAAAPVCTSADVAVVIILSESRRVPVIIVRRMKERFNVFYSPGALGGPPRQRDKVASR